MEFLIGAESPTKVQPNPHSNCRGPVPWHRKSSLKNSTIPPATISSRCGTAEGVAGAGRVRPDDVVPLRLWLYRGPIIILVTLLFTLTTWINVIYDDPVRVALLQTAGLVLGGWLLIAAIRSPAKRQPQDRRPLGLR